MLSFKVDHSAFIYVFILELHDLTLNCLIFNKTMKQNNESLMKLRAL